MAIRIVPDFEPEIENSIIETLSTVAEEIEEKPIQSDSEAGHERTDGFFFEEPGKNLMMMKEIKHLQVVLVMMFIVLEQVMYIEILDIIIQII